jgi:hypothetical protein
MIFVGLDARFADASEFRALHQDSDYSAIMLAKLLFLLNNRETAVCLCRYHPF